MLRMQISDFKDPVLFLYFLSVIYSDFKLKPKHFIHLGRWLISICLLLPNFFLTNQEGKLQFIQNYGQTWEYEIQNTLGISLEIVYIIAEVYYLIRYRKLLLENYTSKTYFQNYYWLRQLIFFILIGQVLTFVKGFVRDSPTPESTDTFRVILLLYGLFFSMWLVWKALHSPKLFRGITVDLKLSKELIDEKRLKKEIPNETKQQIDALNDFMAKNEPYLDASLTVQKLAGQSGLPSKELSVLINQHLGQHFFDFVNSYRIEKAKKLLSDPTQKKLTVLEILYEVGFNSKSSFNTAFKNYTGATPTNYRKTIHNQSLR